MRSTSLTVLAVGVALAALTSCTASTKLTHSWAEPTYAGHQFKKIVVVGVTPQVAVRRMYEDTFVRDLGARGITGVPSYSLVGEGQIDKDEATAKIKDSGADGVLVTRMVDQKTVETYYPPTYSTMAAPAPYYGGWYGYYSMGYTYMTSPGYVATDQVYRLESNLYDVVGDKLAWSGLTETTISTSNSTEHEIQPFIDTLVYDMEQHKILPAKSKK